MKPDDAELRPAGASQATVTTHRAGRTERATDWLADEVPVALVFNGISHAVMLATPADLDDFALGFGLTEGLLAEASELHDVEIQETPLGIEVHMEVAGACEFRLKERRRNLTGRTGCGLCGTESLEHVHRALPAFTSARSALTSLPRPSPERCAVCARRRRCSSPPVPRMPQRGAAPMVRLCCCARTLAVTTRSTSWPVRCRVREPMRARASSASPVERASRWCRRQQ